MLLDAAPETLTWRDSKGRTPLALALECNRTTNARRLMGRAPRQQASGTFASRRAAVETRNYSPSIRQNCTDNAPPPPPQPLGTQPSPGVTTAPPPLPQHSTAEAAAMLRRLPPADHMRFRTLALVLARMQRRLPEQLHPMVLAGSVRVLWEARQRQQACGP